MLQEAGHINNKVVLIFQHNQCLHLMHSEVAWALVSWAPEDKLFWFNDIPIVLLFFKKDMQHTYNSYHIFFACKDIHFTLFPFM